jgi:ribosomal protein RSM22 (predicted rRNA methylase)
MELPPALRQAVDAALAGLGLHELSRAAEALSLRYRGEVRDGKAHLADDLAARAYLATRLPATYAAIRSAIEEVGHARPDFAPQSVLDVGAGPGSAVWAAAGRWPSLTEALLLEQSPAIQQWGERFTPGLAPIAVEWKTADLATGLAGLEPRDLVLLAYVLDELAPEVRAPLIDRLWSLTSDVLLLVEPGTTAGWRRILAARSQLIAAGAHILAPCPHAQACPLVSPDWCHFVRRVARSRIHRLAKAGEVAWEDEKFIYLAVSRRSGVGFGARVLAPPHPGSNRVALKLCLSDGSAQERLYTKREGELYKTARRADWGDTVPT